MHFQNLNKSEFDNILDGSFQLADLASPIIIQEPFVKLYLPRPNTPQIHKVLWLVIGIEEPERQFCEYEHGHAIQIVDFVKRQGLMGVSLFPILSYPLPFMGTAVCAALNKYFTAENGSKDFPLHVGGMRIFQDICSLKEGGGSEQFHCSTCGLDLPESVDLFFCDRKDCPHAS